MESARSRPAAAQRWRGEDLSAVVVMICHSCEVLRDASARCFLKSSARCFWYFLIMTCSWNVVNLKANDAFFLIFYWLKHVANTWAIFKVNYITLGFTNGCISRRYSELDLPCDSFIIQVIPHSGTHGLRFVNHTAVRPNGEAVNEQLHSFAKCDFGRKCKVLQRAHVISCHCSSRGSRTLRQIPQQSQEICVNGPSCFNQPDTGLGSGKLTGS